MTLLFYLLVRCTGAFGDKRSPGIDNATTNPSGISYHVWQMATFLCILLLSMNRTQWMKTPLMKNM